MALTISHTVIGCVYCSSCCMNILDFLRCGNPHILLWNIYSLPHNYISKFVVSPHPSPVHCCCCPIKFLPDNRLFASYSFHTHTLIFMHNVLSLRSSSTQGFLAKARSNLKRLTLNPLILCKCTAFRISRLSTTVDVLCYIPRKLRIRNPNFCCACTIIQNEYFFRYSHLTMLIY